MDIDLITARSRQLRDKVRGDGAARAPLPARDAILVASLGGALGIGVVALLTRLFDADPVFILASFGATCVFVFGYPDVPFSQPRNVIGGHFVSSLAGLSVAEVLGVHWWTAGIAVGAAIAAMMLTGMIHPPAGANPLLVTLGGLGGDPDWDFLFFPTVAGAIIVTAVALIYNNLVRDERYPKYW